MDSLINYEWLNILVTAIGSGLFAGTSVAIYKIINGYFQKDKDKSFSIKKDENGLIEITYTGYSMAELKDSTKEIPIKPIIKELEKPTLRLVNHRKSK